jgi:hypothetical protein
LDSLGGKSGEILSPVLRNISLRALRLCVKNFVHLIQPVTLSYSLSSVRKPIWVGQIANLPCIALVSNTLFGQINNFVQLPFRRRFRIFSPCSFIFYLVI